MKQFNVLFRYCRSEEWYNYIVACLQQYELKHLEASLMKFEEGLKVAPYITRFAKKEDNELKLVQSYMDLRYLNY